MWCVTCNSTSVGLCATALASLFFALPVASKEGDMICVPQPYMSFP